MRRIDLDHWFINENVLSISLMNLYIKIEPYKNFCDMTITDENYRKISLDFKSLEEAISFAEEKIKDCRSNDEVYQRYNKLYEKEDLTKDKIFLFPEDIEEILYDYFGEGKEYRISIESNLFIENNKPKIIYSMIEHLNIDGIPKQVITCLTEENLKNALQDYAAKYNYNMEEFKYCGGIHRVGYFFDEDTPYFDGIILKVKDKSKVLKR